MNKFLEASEGDVTRSRLMWASYTLKVNEVTLALRSFSSDKADVDLTGGRNAVAESANQPTALTTSWTG